TAASPQGNPTAEEGLAIRSSPSSGELLKVWPNGTQVIWLGQEQEVDGVRWMKVRDPDGNIGWMAADRLVRRDGTPQPRQVGSSTSTPAAPPAPAPPPAP